MAKVYGGWGAFGEPKFDGSSGSGGKPVPQGTSAGRAEAAKIQKGYAKVTNCRRCNPKKGQFCGKHAKDAVR